MTTYIVNIFIILILAFIFNNYDKRLLNIWGRGHLKFPFRNLNIIYTTIIVLSLIFIASFRNISVGYDTISYLNIFNEINSMSWGNLWNYNIELGYTFLNKILITLGISYRTFLLLVSLFIYPILASWIVKESKIPWLSFYLFITLGFFGFTLSITRQSIALVLTIISIKFVKKRSLLKFVSIILLASLFHQSALIFLLIYPISSIRINYEYISLATLGGIFLYLYSGEIISILLKFYNRRQPIESGEGRGLFLLLLFVTVSALSVFFFKQEEYKGQIYLHFLILATVLQIIAFNLSIFTRTINYFSIHMIILIPNTVALIKSKEIKYLGIVVILITTFMYYLYLAMAYGGGVFPYLFMWEN